MKKKKKYILQLITLDASIVVSIEEKKSKLDRLHVSMRPYVIELCDGEGGWKLNKTKKK